ncbi:MAG: NACHT domain-containing protein [Polyangiaceae bacterium]|nr:NACHT domain-containing protein [Polyangiaceae bacterium]
MAFAADEAIMGWVFELVLEAVKARVEYTSESYFVRLRINNQIQNAVAQVVEPLLPFFQHEGLDERRQQLLVETCVREMRELLQEPAKLFQASLDGAKLFQQFYAGRSYPEEIRDERLDGIYERLGPQIGSLLCEIPLVVGEWKREKWREDYRRLDEIALQLRRFFEEFDAQNKAAAKDSDDVLRRLRQAQELRVRMQVDLAGLRAEQPLVGKLAQMFVHPELTSVVQPQKGSKEDGPTVLRLANETEALAYFLRNYRRAVLVGPPGSGKSTWTKWLQARALGEKWHGAALRIELRRLAKGRLPSYMDLLREEAGPNLAEELDTNRIRGWVNAGRVVFLLDGFDELPLDRRDDLQQWIHGLSDAVGRCPMIVTSRPLTSNHIDSFRSQWERFDVNEFDIKRIVDYIQAWYTHAPKLADAERTVDAQALATTWQQDPTLKPLTGNPLLLSTLLVVHHHDGQLPSGRAKLYARYVDGMLGGWDTRREVEVDRFKLATEQKRRILRRLALRMHLDSQDQLEEEPAQITTNKALEDFRIPADAAIVLDELRERSGLLIGPGVYNFAHKSIGEFLVAETIVEANERDSAECRIDRMMLYKHRHEDRWMAVLFFWAGLAPAGEVEDFIQTCMKNADWENLLLAMSLVDDQGDRLSPNLKGRLIDAFVERSQSSSIEKYLLETSSWTWTAGRRDWQVEMPKLPLHSLRGRDAVIVAGDWHEAGHFVWDQVRQAQGRVHYMFWFVCAPDPQSIREWQQLLCEAPLPSQGILSPSEPTSRWIVPLYRQLQLNFKKRALPIGDVISIYHQVVPPSEHVVPLLLMLLVLEADAGMKRFKHSNHLLDQKTAQLRGTLELAVEYLDMGLNDTWLAMTTSFPIAMPVGYTRAGVDILQECLDIIAARIADGTVESSADISKVTSTLEQMIARRTEILANGASPSPTADSSGQSSQ